MLLLNFLAGPEDDTRTPLRFTLVGEKAGALDLRSAPVRDFVALLKSRDTIVDPTLAIFDSMFRQRGNDIDPSFAMIAGHMPPNVRRGFHSGALQGAEQHADAYLAAAERQLQLVALLHREGIRLVPGTDSLAGFGLHRELELYAQAGIPVADILRLATIGAARIAGADHALGRIAPGMRAELVLLRDDPLQDINAVRRVLLSIRSDRFYRPEELYREIGVAPFVPSLSAGAHD